MDAADFDADTVLGALADTTSDAVILAAGDGTIRSWNVAAEWLLGPASAGPPPGDPTVMLAALDATDDGALETLVGAAHETGATTHAAELQVRTHTGSTATARLAATPLPIGPDARRGTVVVVRDLTEALALAHFAATAAHDLAEPARTVSGMVQLLARQYRDQLGDDGAELVDFAVDGCARMRDLIDSLLTLARADAAEVRPTEVDLTRLLDDVERDLRAAITTRGAIIAHGELPAVVGSADGIRQVLANLISNAIKFVPVDVVPLVRVGAARGAGEWIVTVDDNGVGIDPEFRDRVFGAFERLHVREAYPGTGIGLAICRRIVERHGGRIWSDVGPDGGTRFAFTLPDPPA